MAADAHTDNFQGLTKVFDKSFFLKIDFFSSFGCGT